jgi:hypothetical protein
MTPCYEYKFVITGNSTNEGRFREEGDASSLRTKDDKRTETELRAQFEKDTIDLFLAASEPWRTNPKYLGVTDLKVELGEIEIIDENSQRQPKPLPWLSTK